MVLLRLTLFTIRMLLFVIKSVLFRIYLLLIFFTKDAAGFLTVFAIAGGLWLAWPLVMPTIDLAVDPLFRPSMEWAANLPPGDAWRQGIELAWEGRYPLSIGMVLLPIYIGLRILRWPLLYVLIALPYPKRPIRPIWPVRARKHHIETVSCTINVPRLPLRWWAGDLKPLIRRLSPELRHIIETKTETDPQKPVIASQIAETLLELPNTAKIEERAPEDVSEPPAARRGAAQKPKSKPVAQRKAVPEKKPRGPKLPPQAKPVQVAE